MRTHTLLLVLLYIVLYLPSCVTITNEEMSDGVLPDTVVLSIEPKRTDVQIQQTDTTYDIISYWTDPVTGRILYTAETESYKHGQLHGTKIEWNENGDTVHLSFWEDGIHVDSSLNWYDSRVVKQRVFYSLKRNGNKEYEVNYHPNGKSSTDTIWYTNGWRNGAVTYYDTTGYRATETYFYADNELIGIEIYNDQYLALDRNARNLRQQIYLDSIKQSKDTLLTTVFAEQEKKQQDESSAAYSEWDNSDEDSEYLLKELKGELPEPKADSAETKDGETGQGT
ncbi:MAG: hypothetical protein GY810_13295 [Aureispira sp.]|nr:hypothetical protein [Aureispira sp.]